ncbi:MAG: NAD(P) transhydrogenase subunit alpha [Chitinophagaceae bacterium]
MNIKIGVLKENGKGENRVSLLPEHVVALKKKGITVLVEKNAGEHLLITDDAYKKAGATTTTKKDVLDKATIILSISCENIPAIKSKILLGVFQPLSDHKLMDKWAKEEHTVFSLDMLPRTTRAQSMDVLSSQANIAGYKAVLTAATMLNKYMPMFTTAAGSIAPARVLILGAGVAGLQAIATARRLGAIVEVFDTRPAVKEEVMSLGAKFVEVEGAADASLAGGYAVQQTKEYKEKQKAKIAEVVQKADVVITTAQIPGQTAPILITKSMIDNMKQGSIIIDLASATGGNTDLTKDNKTVVHGGVSIFGNSNLPSTMPMDASKLYGKNVLNFLDILIPAISERGIDFSDDLIKGACIVTDKNIVNERVINLTKK